MVTKLLEQRVDYQEATRYGDAPTPLVDLLTSGYGNAFIDGHVVPTSGETRARDPQDWRNLLLCGSLLDGETEDTRFIDGWCVSQDIPFVFVSDEHCECETVCYWFDETTGRERIEIRCGKPRAKQCEHARDFCHHHGGEHYLGVGGKRVPSSTLTPLQDLHSLLRGSGRLGAWGRQGTDEMPQVVVPILRLSSFLDLLRICAFWRKYADLRQQLAARARGTSVAAD